MSMVEREGTQSRSQHAKTRPPTSDSILAISSIVVARCPWELELGKGENLDQLTNLDVVIA